MKIMGIIKTLWRTIIVKVSVKLYLFITRNNRLTTKSQKSQSSGKTSEYNGSLENILFKILYCAVSIRLFDGLYD